MSTTARKPAPRLARPAARYWKGKVPKGAGEVEDSDSEDEQESPENEEDVPIEGDQDFAADDEVKSPIRAAVKPATTRAINVALKDVNISVDGKVIVAGREESGRTALEGGVSLALYLSTL
jgi:microfibrillar-associated protein 1